MAEDTLQMNDHEKNKAEARDWCEGKTINDLALKQKEVEKFKDELEVKMKRTNAWLDVLRMEAIPKKAEEMGLESPIKLEGIGRISIVADVLVSVKAGQKEALNNWLVANGLSDIIQETVNSSTLKAAIKKRMTAGEEYPDDLLNITPFERASILK